jgi:two-component system NtrC family sensor kinase
MKITIDRESPELLRTLAVLGLPAFIVDKQGTILSCNDAVLSFFEYGRSSVISQALDKFISIDIVPRMQSGAYRPEDVPSSMRSFCFRKNGSPVSSRIAVIPCTDQSGRTIVVVRDSAGVKAGPMDAASAGRQEKLSQGELISELSSIINSSLSIGTIFRMVVSELRKIIHYSRASLLLYSEKDDNLLIFALDTEMKTEMPKGVKAPIKGTSAGWVVRNNKPWISHDLQDTSFPLDRKLEREGIRSTISIPLFHDRMLGVFNFDSAEPGQYSEKDLEILLPVAKHIAIALENALLFEEISKEKKEWERTFDAITDMVWIEDGRQKVIRANHTLLLKTGFSKTEITEKHCGELLEKIGVMPPGGCLCRETLSSKRPTFQELKSYGNSIFHFWAYPLIDEEGRLYAIVHYLKDVTAQKRLEHQLIRSDRLASLGTLVAGIAHEINNPLGIIAGYSEALLDRTRDAALNSVKEFEDFPGYLKTIHNEIFRCKTILRSLLEFARPSGGTFREIDINELIKEVLLLLKHRTARLQHRLELDLNRDVPKIHADAGSLRQLLMNLLLNAIYFTPEGGGIFIKTETDDSWRENGFRSGLNRIRLSVTDTGAGISEELIDKVFDPFFTTKPVGEGTGLGLTICHRIVEEHGGTIDVKSRPGKGTTFIITLPSIT